MKNEATPKIVCLCGSTKFMEAFQEANTKLTLAGNIVLSVGCGTKGAEGITDEQKAALDELHLRKIDLADEVFILNVGGYIGQSTRRELAYAVAKIKKLRFLEPKEGERFMEEHSHELGLLVAKFTEWP